MKVVAVLVATLFLSSVVTWLVAGLGGQERARTEHADLLRRIERTREARVTLPPVSYAEAEALAAERDRLDELGDRRLALLTDPRDAPRGRTLGSVLADLDLPGLAEGAPLRTQVEAWAADDPAAEAVLARLLALVDEADVAEVESLSRRREDSLAVPDLAAEAWELVVVSEMDSVLAFLERLVPGHGEPVLSVTSASLRRIDPTLWSTLPDRLEAPPVRLSVRVEAHRVRPTVPGGRP